MRVEEDSSTRKVFKLQIFPQRVYPEACSVFDTVPFILGIILLKLGLGTSLTMPILILAGVLSARLMYKKNWVK